MAFTTLSAVFFPLCLCYLFLILCRPCLHLAILIYNWIQMTRPTWWALLQPYLGPISIRRFNQLWVQTWTLSWLKPETHCMLFGCPRQKNDIVNFFGAFSDSPWLFHDANLLSGTGKNHAVCLCLYSKMGNSWVFGFRTAELRLVQSTLCRLTLS